MKQTPFTNNQSTKSDLLRALIKPLEIEVAEQKKYLQKTNDLFFSYVERIIIRFYKNLNIKVTPNFNGYQEKLLHFHFWS